MRCSEAINEADPPEGQGLQVNREWGPDGLERFRISVPRRDIEISGVQLDCQINIRMDPKEALEAGETSKELTLLGYHAFLPVSVECLDGNIVFLFEVNPKLDNGQVRTIQEAVLKESQGEFSAVRIHVTPRIVASMDLGTRKAECPIMTSGWNEHHGVAFRSPIESHFELEKHASEGLLVDVNDLSGETIIAILKSHGLLGDHHRGADVFAAFLADEMEKSWPHVNEALALSGQRPEPSGKGGQVC